MASNRTQICSVVATHDYIVLGIQSCHAVLDTYSCIVSTATDSCRIDLYLVLSCEQSFATACLNTWPRLYWYLADNSAPAITVFTFAFLETACQVGRSIIAHVNLNLVQTVAHTARLASTHLVQRELFRGIGHSGLLFVLVV